MTDPTQIAERVKAYRRTSGKPVLASWMGGVEAAAGEAILNAAGHSRPFPSPTRRRAFLLMASYNYNLKGLYETPAWWRTRLAPQTAGDLGDILRRREPGRTLLTEFEAKEVFKAYGIPVVETRIATSAEDAVAARRPGVSGGPQASFRDHHAQDGRRRRATQSGGRDGSRRAYQAIQESVTAKAGAEHFDGVTVQKMVRSSGAYELILGSSIDSQFGPVLLFGTGGQLVEIFQDSSLAIPPLNTTLARRMMEQTQIYKALHGVRGRKPVDLAALERLLVRFSQLVMEQPWIKEIDINPLLVSSDDIIALDARIILHDKGVGERAAEARDPPVPVQYVGTVDSQERDRGAHPADSSGRRAADGALPSDAFGA